MFLRQPRGPGRRLSPVEAAGGGRRGGLGLVGTTPGILGLPLSAASRLAEAGGGGGEGTKPGGEESDRSEWDVWIGGSRRKRGGSDEGDEVTGQAATEEE